MIGGRRERRVANDAGRRRDVDREIRQLAVPAALALATDPIYDLSDTAILGRIGTEQLAGAAVATRVLSFGYAAFVFLMFATTAAVARHRGAGDDRAATSHAVGGVWIAGAIGLAAAGVFAVVGRPLIALFGADGRVAEHAWTYLAISLAGLPAFTIVLVGVGYVRGRGDARLTFWIALGCVSLNLVMEIVTVFGFGLGVGASAASTVIAKWTGATIYLAVIRRAASRHGAGWRPVRTQIGDQLRVGGDLVVRTIVLLGVLSAAQAWAARIGTVELAAHAIAYQLWSFAAYSSDGLEAAAQTMVAHRIGAGRPGEVRLVVRRLLTWSVRFGAAFGVVLAATAWWSPRLFTADAAVIAAATGTVLWVAAFQPVASVAFALDGILVGAARQRFLAIAMAISAVVFAVAAVAIRALGYPAGLGGVWAAISVFMVVRMAVAVSATR